MNISGIERRGILGYKRWIWMQIFLIGLRFRERGADLETRPTKTGVSWRELDKGLLI